MQHHLGIAAGNKPVTGTAQALTQLDIVVDLTGVDQHHFGTAAGGVAHRLRPATQIDNRQTPMPEQGVLPLPYAFGIRASSGEASGHLSNDRGLTCEYSRKIDPSSNSTHIR